MWRRKSLLHFERRRIRYGVWAFRWYVSPKSMEVFYTAVEELIFVLRRAVVVYKVVSAAFSFLE